MKQALSLRGNYPYLSENTFSYFVVTVYDHGGYSKCEKIPPLLQKT
jgi:hypothetical protein